jgi:uncharacterized protein
MAKLSAFLGCFVLILTIAHANAADLNLGTAAYQRGDFNAALAEFKPLANKGDPVAQYHLCGMHVQGNGVAQDFAKAVHWCGKAAEAGIPEAQTVLAGLKMLGLGTKRDRQDGYFWTIISAIWSKGDLRTAAMDALTQVSRMIDSRDKADIASDAVRAWRR